MMSFDLRKKASALLNYAVPLAAAFTVAAAGYGLYDWQHRQNEARLNRARELSAQRLQDTFHERTRRELSRQELEIVQITPFRDESNPLQKKTALSPLEISLRHDAFKCPAETPWRADFLARFPEDGTLTEGYVCRSWSGAGDFKFVR